MKDIKESFDKVEQSMMDVRAFDLGMSSDQYKKIIDEVFKAKRNAQNKQRKGKGSIQS
mgnify:CR=1 FL=1